MEYFAAVAGSTYVGLTYLGQEAICDDSLPGISAIVSGQWASSVSYHRKHEHFTLMSKIVPERRLRRTDR
jgi:hypothetical protein